MADRRCCCAPQECVDFFDDFYRPDSTNLGSDWNEVVGDWEIAGYTLYEPGTPNAVVICTTQLPSRSGGEMTMAVTVYDHQIGDKYYLYPACIDTNTVGPISVEFEKIDAVYWRVSIIGSSCTDATIIQQAAYNADGSLPITCCVDDDRYVGMMRASVQAAPASGPLWCDDADAGAGRYCGLGHNNATGAVFDDFGMTELRKSEYPRDIAMECANCWCWCLNNALDKHLSAQFRDVNVEFPSSSTKTRAGCLTQTWDMDWDFNSGNPRWHGTVTVPATVDGGLETEFNFTLQCTDSDDDNDSWPGHNIQLFFDVGTGCMPVGTGAGPYYPMADYSACQPLDLLFGPFTLICSDLDCSVCWAFGTPSTGISCDTADNAYEGEYYIRITDA